MISVLDDWLEHRRGQLSPATVDRYRVAIKRTRPVIGKMAVARLEAHHLEDFYAKLHREGLSGASIRKIHWAMRQSLAWAKRRGFVDQLATEGVELPPLGAKTIAPPSSESVAKVIQFALEAEPEFGTICALIAWTGCRRGEVCGLRWRDVDLVGQELLYERSVVAVPGGRMEKSTKTGELRRIALGSATIALLQAHLARRRELAQVVGVDLDPNGFVFSPDVTMAEAWHPQTISHRFLTTGRKAGVPPMRLHDLRHHSATALLKSGVSIGEVMDRHGWKTLEMVSRYRHLMEAKDRSAAETLERLAAPGAPRTAR